MADVALVTGGAGGVGRAVARALHEAGHPVVLLGRGLADLERAAAEVGASCVVADVRDRASVAAAVRRARDLAGPPLVLVNAAGIAESSPLVPPDDALWDRTFAANVTGAWIASTEVLPGMLEARRGRIVNVASTAGLYAYRHVAAYVASKHALVGLTRAMAADLEGTGVTVNAVCPGFLDTPMTDRTVRTVAGRTGRGEADARAAIAALNARGALIPPSEVAAAVRRLVADPSRTGAAVPIE